MAEQSSGGIRSIPEQVEALTTDTVSWLKTDSEAALLAMAVAVGLYFLFEGMRWGLARLLGGSGDVTTLRGFAGRIIRRTRTLFMATLAAYLVINGLNAPPVLTALVEFVFTVSFAVQGAMWLREIILAVVERRADASEDPAAFASALGIIRVLVSVAVWALALIMILDNLGVNVTALVAGLGVGGIAIGLAAQGIFSDLFAALAIIFDRPFKVGDMIQFGTQTGRVEAIGLKTVRLRLLSGEQLVVGNTQLLGQQISNLRRVESRRVAMLFGVTYQTPPKMMARLSDEVKAVVDAEPDARFDRCFFIGFGASSLDFELVFFVDSDELPVMLAARHRIGIALMQRLAELDVDFAYPSQTLFLAGPDGRAVDPRERAAFKDT